MRRSRRSFCLLAGLLASAACADPPAGEGDAVVVRLPAVDAGRPAPTSDAGHRLDAASPGDVGRGPDATPPADAGQPPDGTPPIDTGPSDAAPAPRPDTAPPPPPDPCQPIAGVRYETLSSAGPPSDRPAPQHADLNLHLRGWAPTGGALGLIELNGPTDARAPKLNTLFADDRVPAFSHNYRVNQWDWGCNCRGGPIEDWEVTLAGMVTHPGEILELPRSGYDIGEGFGARVLYIDDDSITLKLTREDNVVSGYTVHVVGVCVEPSLRALYDDLDAAGRPALPALRNDQAFGRAAGAEIQVAIRDTGAFMDPRSRKDWW